MRPFIVTLILLALMGGGAVAQSLPSDIEPFERDRLAIRTAEGTVHELAIEVAMTREQRARGLMFRDSMAADHGMLFIYPSRQIISMWMKNTYIPLDMLFIRADGEIAHIVKRATPMSLKVISSREPVSAVLELNSGTADRLGIEPGDEIVHPAFASAGDGAGEGAGD